MEGPYMLSSEISKKEPSFMNDSDTSTISTRRLDYGIDAPAVLRNLFLFGVICILLSISLPASIHIGKIDFLPRSMFRWTGICLLVEGILYVIYVKKGKFRHRDYMLSLHPWSGEEQVLDVGCGRGLLLVGAAKRLTSGHGTGIDIWSTEDLSGNAEAATRQNLELEGVADLCSLVSQSAAEMPFADASFDVVVSNLCLHNLYQRSSRLSAVQHIARVLKPGGVAILSDYKLTGEYAEELRRLGFEVSKHRGGFTTTFPPLTVVVARKPL
jgi:arsenite methyltransferase